MLIIWSYFIYKAIICVAVFAVSLGIAAYSTWWERKFAGLLQDRYGPKRAGPFGRRAKPRRIVGCNASIISGTAMRV
jgi:NADH:ubiquinone oxidoreductase subunit H